MAKVINFGTPILLGDLGNGQIAEVLEWFDCNVSVGDIIQRQNNMIFILGKSHFYSDINQDSERWKSTAKVRVLPQGTTIML